MPLVVGVRWTTAVAVTLPDAVALGDVDALRRHFDEAEQRAHVEQSSKSMAQRARRDVIGDSWLSRHRHAGRDDSRPAEDELATVDEFESQTSVGDAAVERIEHGDGRRRRWIGGQPGAVERLEYRASIGPWRRGSKRPRAGSHVVIMIAGSRPPTKSSRPIGVFRVGQVTTTHSVGAKHSDGWTG